MYMLLQGLALYRWGFNSFTYVYIDSSRTVLEYHKPFQYIHTYLLLFIHVRYEVDSEVCDGRLEPVAIVNTLSLTGELTMKTITNQPN